ncbi:MAG: bifunctional folylpolyglutamate synthase/dihydrofolate synthase [Muribaculaceae bacterium]|nr:bifunctional folylpolyglutamate synthase/dihydrofolate synthase [Muribaculaceae bacterium]
MTYEETLDYLYTKTPMFQSIGAGAYKPGLDTVKALSKMFGNPHKRLKTIHVGGTNGKGSTAHTIAAVLQSAGYKVGLFTSPHLIDFRERIRVDGEMIGKEKVVDFVDRFIAAGGEKLCPSFFELTTIMAFEHFAESEVDVAVIEVGLGGRLDSTNIIVPDLSVITNISKDHTALLGDTLPEIAAEKAGIIKEGVPVVIGESEGDVRNVFRDKAALLHSPIYYADDIKEFEDAQPSNDKIIYKGTKWGDITGELCGDCQTKNAATILCTLDRLNEIGYKITPEAVSKGFSRVSTLTGLAGRWMKISENPTVICDTGHNVGGWEYLSKRLANYGDRLHMVIGFVNDKDISGILSMMPANAHYYFVKPSVNRGLSAEKLTELANKNGLEGLTFETVAEGYEKALSQLKEGDTIFVGGSTFVVADILALIERQ